MVEKSGSGPAIIRIGAWTYRLQQRLITGSEPETRAWAKQWAKILVAGDIVAFYGDLGSGKTTFIRGLCEGLAVAELVSSPTFTLINEYRGAHKVFHMDLYRIHHVAELRDVGVEEYFYHDGICLIEWPEVIEQQLPRRHYAVQLSFDFSRWGPMERQIEVMNVADTRD